MSAKFRGLQYKLHLNNSPNLPARMTNVTRRSNNKSNSEAHSAFSITLFPRRTRHASRIDSGR